MQAFSTPAYLQDANQLLTADGFALQGKWYHGTASGLIDSIQEFGLRGTGDLESLKHHLETLGTIGHEASKKKDPLFLTQSKELAYYWALQRANIRNRYKGAEEQPVVYKIELPEELNKQIITDAGGAALLLEPGNMYIALLKEIYNEVGVSFPELDPFKCDRMEYLNKLGLAYTLLDIEPQYIKLLQAQ